MCQVTHEIEDPITPEMLPIDMGETGGLSGCWKWLWRDQENGLLRSGFINRGKLPEYEFLLSSEYSMIYCPLRWTSGNIDNILTPQPLFVLSKPYVNPRFDVMEAHELWYCLAIGLRCFPKYLFGAVTPSSIEHSWLRCRKWGIGEPGGDQQRVGHLLDEESHVLVADKVMPIIRVDVHVENKAREKHR